jgi:hypothetical protein
MEPENQPIFDWVNVPESAQVYSLWGTLHDGYLEAVESDRLARTVTLRFDVDYVRDFHHLPEGARFTIVLSGVQSVRAFKLREWPGEKPVMKAEMSGEEQDALWNEYRRKERDESIAWGDFERPVDEWLEVDRAELSLGPAAAAIRIGLHFSEAFIRGDGIAFYAGDKQVTLEEFIALGVAYWDAFEKKYYKS